MGAFLCWVAYSLGVMIGRFVRGINDSDYEYEICVIGNTGILLLVYVVFFEGM